MLDVIFPEIISKYIFILSSSINSKSLNLIFLFHYFFIFLEFFKEFSCCFHLERYYYHHSSYIIDEDIDIIMFFLYIYLSLKCFE